MLGALLLLTVLVYTGFCFQQLRFVPDQEVIDTVVTQTLERYPPSLRFSETRTVNGELTREYFDFIPTEPIRYAGLNDFYLKNPNCCELTLQGGEGTHDTPPLWQRLCGQVVGFVRVRYDVVYVESGIRKVRAVDHRTPVSRCGDIVDGAPW